MVSNIYLLFGVEEGASLAEIKRAYARLMGSLQSPPGSSNGPASHLAVARERLSQAYESLQDPQIRKAYESWPHRPEMKAEAAGALPAGEEAYCRPKLGQLLVASGLITLEELDAALEIQKHTHHSHIPLGELLVAASYLTEQQLDYYLRMQTLMTLPADHPQRWGQRLVELGLVTEDQLKVALIEQKTTGSTLRQALINRGWLTSEVLDRIF